MKQIIHKIFHRMKEDSLVKKTAERRRIKEYPGTGALKSCLVVWCANDRQTDYLIQLEKKLPGIKLDKICFLPEGYQALQLDCVTYVKSEELGFGGKILNEQLPALLDKEFDLLVDLSEGPNVMIEYILKNSLAKCKVGMKKENFEADLMLDGVAGVPEFIDKLFEVLAKLKKY